MDYMIQLNLIMEIQWKFNGNSMEIKSKKRVGKKRAIPKNEFLII